MNNLARAISEDGSVMVCAVNSTNIVNELEKIHKTSAVVTAGLGRLTTGAAIMGSMLKGEKDSITLRVKGDGPIGTMIAVSDSKGNVKSYVSNPIVELPLNSYGKLDVSGAVGKNGQINIIKDLGLKEPYVGQTPIVSGEIAEDLTYYYATSEQIPTVFGLGVLVNPDLTVKSAGGYLVQLLPFADEKCIDVIEKNIDKLPPVSTMFSEGLTPEEVAMKILDGLNPNVLDSFNVAYKCDCSSKRVEKALISIGVDELNDIISTQDNMEIKCHFCNKAYNYNKEHIIKLIEKLKK